jgi:Asp-tRNA(Asn)/Glu-tRNA(Gln) amidotransferase A subunit family amidase
MRHRGLHLILLVLLASSSFGAGQPPGSFHLEEVTIDAVRAALESGQVTCRTLVNLYLKRIEAYNHAGPALNAVQNVNPLALEEADRLDAAFKASGPVGKLHCVPVLVKDQVETKDMPTTFGSAVFKEFIPQRDATVVVKLKESGAIILGKATMGEFANGYVGSAFGFMRNAYDTSRVASGSSGGTGAGVAANLATIGIAEDTGGSTRGPAAVNNLVGLRPTVPLVSRHGMMPATPTRDTLGPITRSVRDAALVLDVIAGYDPNDAITAFAYGQVPPTYTAFLKADGLKGARIGVIRDPMDRNADPTSDDYKKVRAVMDRAIADLTRLGAVLVDPIKAPGRGEAAPPAATEDSATTAPRTARASGAARAAAPTGGGGNYETEQAINAYLAQHPNAPAKTLREILLSGKVSTRRARELMGAVGRSTTEPGFGQLMITREETRQAWLKMMADNRLEAVVYATFDHQPVVIPPDILTNPDAGDGYARGSNRSISPTLGWPALTVPAGFTVDKLPVGMEFMARPFDEGTLLKLAYAYEQSTRHRKASPLTPPLHEEP